MRSSFFINGGVLRSKNVREKRVLFTLADSDFRIAFSYCRSGKRPGAHPELGFGRP